MKNSIFVAVAVLVLQSLCAADQHSPSATKKPCDPCFYPTCPPGTHIFYPPKQRNGCPGCPKCVQNKCVESTELQCPALMCADGEYLQDTKQSNGCPGCPVCAKCPVFHCPMTPATCDDGYFLENEILSNGCVGCASCAKCPVFHCPMTPATCDDGYFLENEILSNGCVGCASCRKCVPLFCPAAVCQPGKTYSQMGTQPNGCSGCPACVACKPHICSDIYCPDSTPTTDENGCPGCPQCHFTPITVNATNA